MSDAAPVVVYSWVLGLQFPGAPEYWYDDCAEQLLDTDPFPLRDTVEFGVDVQDGCLHILDFRHSTVQYVFQKATVYLRCYKRRVTTVS